MTRYILLVVLLVSILGYSQNGINYKALIKDDLGNVIANSSVGIKFKILESDAQTNVYEETHSSTTDSNGIIIVNIGKGTIISGVFDAINWGNDNHFLNVKIDSGSGFINLGTIQFSAVPYAFHAKKAANVKGLEPLDEGNGIGWRLVNRNTDNYDNIGFNAIDLSFINDPNLGLGATGSYAFSLGHNGTASGEHALAFGNQNYALNDYSIALGNNNNVTGLNSTAIGGINQVSGDYAFVAGLQNVASENYTVVLGNGTTASGEYAIAMGQNVAASGFNSTALGHDTIASGEYATAIGIGTEASGNWSVSLGNETEASGSSSTAMGTDTKASGANSTAFGVATEASDGLTTAMGHATKASGTTATAMGNLTEASNFASTSMGDETEASGYISTAMGDHTMASARISTAIGSYNIGGGSSSVWVSSDPLFEIGNGQFNTPRSNALTVLKNGNVGIGTHTPQELLHISGGRIRIGSETIEDTGNNRLSFNADLLPDVNEGTQLGNSSFRWLGLWAADGTINTSDRRNKTNIKTINYGLSEILKMNPVSFNWKNRKNQDTKLGLIAQDLLELVPEVVKTHDWQTTSDDENAPLKKVELDRLGVYYSDLIPVLINAIKEQNLEIEKLKIALETQKSMEERIASLEQKISD